MGIGRRLLGRAMEKLESLGEVSEEQLAAMSPEQRRQYEYWTARADAARSGQVMTGEDPRLVGRALQGEAGAAAAGIGRISAPAPVTDPALRDGVAARERAARDERRAPFRAPHQHPVRVTRVATRGGTQGREIAEYLGASGLAGRPDLVYGAARVPDRIGPLRGGEQRRVVEWDVVHAATAGLPSAPVPGEALLDAGRTWVARRVGEPSVLDEDVAVAVLATAGIGPEHTLGVARHVVVDVRGGDEHSDTTAWTEVTGVRLLVAPSHAAALAAAARPAALPLPPGPPDGVHVEVLNWAPIARVVQPVRTKLPPVPSPFPHLPLSAIELVRAYLEVVGVAPADSYGVQVTYDDPDDLMSRTSANAHVRKNFGGDKLPCADGEERPRLAGGTQVVLAYRDRPAYAEGRERWAAYCAQELQADLGRELGLRRPVPKPTAKLLRAAERVIDVAAFFTDDPDTDLSEPRPRYCWPPR